MTLLRNRAVLKSVAWSLVVGGLVAALAAQPQPNRSGKASGFTLEDAGGKKHTLAEYTKGKALLVAFWATWADQCTGPNCCPPSGTAKKGAKPESKPFVPYLNELVQRHKKGQVTAVVISLDQKREAAETTLKLNGAKLPLLFDTELEVSKSYGVTRLPTVFVIDGKGVIAEAFSGFNSGSEKDRKSLEESCAALLR